MYRVSRKYIMSCETFDNIEEKISENQTSRNMIKRWLDYKVRIISDVDMHEDIEPEKKRFVLLKKL